ncbi:phosphotransferase [Mycolicibacterium palauense]|uniref:phosphotransferase n=1 Tax=Mycolicibacterium palauense TaxID=2034511 RepID=UPI000BFF07C1|nr:phosphotransferase [Mycolicibacterium palauense]
MPVLRFGRHLGRGARRLAVDAALGSRRAHPRRVEDLDAATLSRIIGRPVSTVAVLDGQNGTSSRARLALTGDGVPDSVFVKVSAASAATRMLGELARLGETESRFYRELAADLGEGVPRSYGSAFDPVTGRYVVVLEDMTGSECEFPDTLHPLDKDHMALLVEFLGRLHGTFWGRLPEKQGGAGRFGWLWAPSTDPANVLTGPLMRMSARKLAGRTRIPVETGRYIWENYQAVTEIVDAGPHTVLHGDSHPGNTFFRDGHAGLLDWQVVRRGHPSRDLTHTVVLAMTTADRQAVQADLLEIYRKSLAAHGGPEFGRDELWWRYRQSAPYSFVSALTTAALGGMQDDAIAMEGLNRTLAALEDLETVAALQESM